MPLFLDVPGTEFRLLPPDSEHASLLLSMPGAQSGRSGALQLEDFAGDNDGVFLVAYVNGQPTGCGGYRVLPGDLSGVTVEIALMYVRPDSRRAGVARAILQELERLAVSDGFSQTVLRVADTRSGMWALAEITGYRGEVSLDDDMGHGYTKSLR